MSNDVLVAQKTESGIKAKVYDGECLEFERQNQAVKNRRAAQLAKEEAYKKAEHRRKVLLGTALGLSTAVLIGCVVFGLMHHILGMVFVSGASAAIGYRLK